MQAVIGASFRDPAGFVFKDQNGNVLRQVNQEGEADYAQYIASGLHDELVGQKLIVAHKEVDLSHAATSDAAKVIKPQKIPFISYPFEWSFGQLQDAALLTLELQRRALARGMVLKDASAYNVQFVGGKPIFIDTLSFEAYQAGKPWQAYRQFCQHFLAPLALMAYTDVRLQQLARVHLDGVPLDLASKLLPRSAKMRPGIALHIVIHGRAQGARADKHQQTQRQLSQAGLEAIIGSLERTVRRLKAPVLATEWGDYYNNTNYTVASADQKAQLIRKFMEPLKVRTAIDLGGNSGPYSRVLNGLGIQTVCADIDPNAVEANYRIVKRYNETDMLPLLVDITNPGGALGWQNNERETADQRLRCDAVMALALVHHLAISNNLPLGKIAEYLKAFGTYLVIEFVPKGDSQAQKLLSTRKDIFPEYNEAGFKAAFSEHYKLVQESKIRGSKRTLYLWRRR